MFKKSKRNFRSNRTDFDSEEENVSVKTEPSKSTSFSRTSEEAQYPSQKPKSDGKTNKLSFEDEEDVVEFKLKKSKESRRIAREQKKSKKEKEKNVLEQDGKISIKKEENSSEILFNEEVRIKPLKKVEKNLSKYLTNKYSEENIKSEEEFESYQIESDEEAKPVEQTENDKLRRLREEFEILTGEDLDPVERETDEAKRSMKLMLKSGIIPDANLIHEARKKRQMARQGDFIPIERSKPASGKSTLVKEEEEDLSEDEHGVIQKNSRLNMNYREEYRKERHMTRSNFLAFEQGSDDDNESDFSEDELERWEKEQIKKGVQISQFSSTDFNDIKKTKFIEKLLGANLESEPMEIESSFDKAFAADKLSTLSQITFLSIKESLKTNLNSLEETHRSHLNEYNMTVENLSANKIDLENLKKSKPSLDEQYTFYQELKAYLTDFIDCYNEKIVEIEKTEQRWLEMHKEKCSMVLKRRHENLRDQNSETSLSISASKKPLEPAHLGRTRQRENRRSMRRAQRQSEGRHPIELNEGFSTDDEESPEDMEVFEKQKQEMLKQLRENCFTDVLEDFYRFNLIKKRFEKWKKLNEHNYKNAFVSLSLPKLFSPLIRFDLIDWNPLEKDLPDFLEKTDWFKELISFQNQNLSDDDLMLVPYIVEKVVLNKLIAIADSVYDPFSTKQSKNFSNLVLNLVKTYPTVNGQSLNTKKFIETIIARFKRTFDEEVFVPLYSKQLIEQRSSEASRFFHRQFYSCAKVFSNVLLWQKLLSEGVLKELAIDCLLNRYMLIALQNMNSSIQTIQLIEYLVKKLPKNWLETNIEATNTMNLPQLLSLIRLVRRIADQIHDNDLKQSKISSSQFKEQIQTIRKLFLVMGASDQAIALSNAYDL
ncbi:PAX3- and PAX7-binding [Brachionus plicatilis]|uniref:PAX3-and PAX7-binding n=1 Tax=Brachionus plicatilis TaxID=10195 RepID=A0A3M7PD36_BRAPC|nr:PAX3- and PAX7-binding [Brachionus plicatilis]